MDSQHAPTQPATAAVALHRVLIVERRLPSYRVALFEALRVALAERGIELVFAHGQPNASEHHQRDLGHLGWARPVRTWYLGSLCWQPFATRGFDLCIVGHENRLLFNLWLCRPWRRFALAYFGHGANLASEQPDGGRERFKRWTARRADWWFAYTSISVTHLHRAGVAPDRITVVNNSIQTRELSRHVDDLDAVQRGQWMARLDLCTGKTALFIGSLYPAKRLDWLLDAAQICAAADPAFRLIVIGDGELAPLLHDAARTHGRWLRWQGALHGPARAEVLALADVLLLPAAVGLAVLDGFAAGLPLLTTSSHGHGPEIAYLEPGVNGELTEPDAHVYAQAVLLLLGDAARLRRMRVAARDSALRYSLEAMVDHFVGGIQAALARSP